MDRLNLDATLRAHQAAAAANVSKQTFNYWRRDGGPLKPAGYDRAGRALYRLGDVLDVERETRRNTGKSHRTLVTV